MKTLLSFTLLPALFLLPMSILAETHAEFMDSCSVCHSTETSTTASGNVATPNRFYATWETTPATVDRTSLLCLSCHSAIAPEAARPKSTWLASGAGSDTGRGQTHPIGVDFERARNLRGGLRSSGTPSGLGGSIREDLLVDGRVECTSCHDIHRAEKAPYLSVSNDGSALCLICHEK